MKALNTNCVRRGCLKFCLKANWAIGNLLIDSVSPPVTLIQPQIAWCEFIQTVDKSLNDNYSLQFKAGSVLLVLCQRHSSKVLQNAALNYLSAISLKSKSCVSEK